MQPVSKNYYQLAGIFCLVAVLLFARNEHKQRPHTELKITPKHRTESTLPLPEPQVPVNCFVKTATAEIGVTETGNNRGTRIGQYLAVCGLPQGYAWCAAFVCWCAEQCNIAHPKNAMAAVVSTYSVIWRPGKPLPTNEPNLVFGLYYNHLGRIGHTGIITGFSGNAATTIEGNTNGKGDREGDGVHAKVRPLNTLYVISQYNRNKQANSADDTGSSLPQVFVFKPKYQTAA